MQSELYRNLKDATLERSEGLFIDTISIGLGYTAVTTSDGSCGVSFTYLDKKEGCTVVKDPMDYEGKPVRELLKLLDSEKLVERSAAIALINAVNNPASAELPEDDGTLFAKLGIAKGTRCAMVGYFGPVVAQMEKAGAHLEVIDEGKGMGNAERFFRYMESEAEALILTSTSIINGSTESILGRLRSGARCAMLGPTTPIMPEAFRFLPVDYLGGISVVNPEGVLAAVRHGKGTPAINRHAKKVLCQVHPPKSTTAGSSSRPGSLDTEEK